MIFNLNGSTDRLFRIFLKIGYYCFFTLVSRYQIQIGKTVSNKIQSYRFNLKSVNWREKNVNDRFSRKFGTKDRLNRLKKIYQLIQFQVWYYRFDC